MKSIMSVLANIINIVQIIVPILLLLILAYKLMQMMINPEEKKNMKQLTNLFTAAVVVFFIPILVNLFVNMTDQSINISACLKESRNTKISTSSSYISPNKKKPSKIVSSSTYEQGDEKKTDDNGTTTSYNPSGAPISTTCTLGDSNVKLKENDSGAHGKIIAKANGQDVANYAKSWLNQGLTYKLGSSGELRPGGQCDCSHFVYRVLKHFGIIDHQIKSTVWGSCNVKGTIMYSDVSRLVPGDVVFMGFNSRGVGHVEVYIGNGETIGCNSGKGVTHGTHASRYTSFIHLTAYD
jgi:cell wall-associated NlpC family hydrolase